MCKGFHSIGGNALGFLLIIATVLVTAGCAGGGGGGIEGAAESSVPINPREEMIQHQALIRCHKTGGTRIVKINGDLRCF